jgi:hypothetical protein
MSTTLAPSTVQQCFPWFQSNETTEQPRRQKKSPTSAAGSQSASRQMPREQSVAVELQPASSQWPNHSSRASTSKQVVSDSVTAQPLPRTSLASSSVALNASKRVGEVRIGLVMMKLLKSYGITDEEIAQVLNTIAQEQQFASVG